MKTRISQWESPNYIKEKIPFNAGSFHAHGDKSGYYVMSYGTIIAEWWEGVWYINDTKYSVTTAKHQSYVKTALSYPGSHILEELSIHFYHIPFGSHTLVAWVRDKWMIRRERRIRKAMGFC